jgi:hypothetical protein
MLGRYQASRKKKKLSGVGATSVAEEIEVVCGRPGFEVPVVARLRRRPDGQRRGARVREARTQESEKDNSISSYLSSNKCLGLTGKSKHTTNRLLKTLK